MGPKKIEPLALSFREVYNAYYGKPIKIYLNQKEFYHDNI